MKFKVGDRVIGMCVYFGRGKFEKGNHGQIGTIIAFEDSINSNRIIVRFDDDPENVVRNVQADTMSIFPQLIQIPNQPIAKENIENGKKIWIRAIVCEDGLDKNGNIKTTVWGTDLGRYTWANPSHVYEREGD